MPRLLEASDAAIAEAASRLRAGGVVAFPTETVYGLGAGTFDVEGLKRVYEIKGRPADNPLIAHVAGEDGARRVAAAWDERCRRLAGRFWPGPLTLVVARAGGVPDLATAGWPTIAVRSPAHPVARRLLDAYGAPISAPSANRSGRVSPTTAAHVADDLAGAGDLLVLDGGPCAVGIESTVLDVTGPAATILRPGAIDAAQLRAELGEVAEAAPAGQGPSPGTSGRHYAPRTPARLVPAEALAALAGAGETAAVLCFDAGRVPAPHRAIPMPAQPQAYAARLYSALREADRSGARRILIEEPPRHDGMWAAIRDRLARLAGG